jgi:hypothetical protein
MKTLYFDAFSGASGDMILGALLDLGVPEEVLHETVKKLSLPDVTVRIGREGRHGIHGIRLSVIAPSEDASPHRSLRRIETMIQGAHLPSPVKELSLRVFRRLASAEGKIHGIPAEEVTFHEVGAVDSIVDIVGCVACLQYLGACRFLASPLPLGMGMIPSRHGLLPVPAPATLEILRGVPVRQVEVEAELVTPTGAALLKEVVEAFVPLPPMEVERIGYGVGGRDLAERPNLLRVVLGKAIPSGGTYREDWILEANIDDMNPEFCEHLMERLLSRGALDVTWTPLLMKKGRPGGLLRLLSPPSRLQDLSETLMRESTTIGVRCYPVRRRCLERSHETVETPWGPVRVKVSRLQGEVVNALPEYEDCRCLAERTGVPLKEIYLEALARHRSQGEG